MNVSVKLKTDDNEAKVVSLGENTFNRYLCSYLIDNKDTFIDINDDCEVSIHYDSLLGIINSFTPP